VQSAMVCTLGGSIRRNALVTFFPQVFTHAIDDLVSRVVGKPTLGTCCFEDEHCDCRQVATIHDLDSHQEFCTRHFLVTNRGTFGQTTLSSPPIEAPGIISKIGIGISQDWHMKQRYQRPG
jgi:hypothetical protein